jgi:hypothetical protein
MFQMSDSEFEDERSRRSAPEVPAIPRWRSHPPPGLQQYLEQQRIRMGQEQHERAPGPLPVVVNQMEQALGEMERVLEDQNTWKSVILPRGHIIEGFFTRRAVLAKLKVHCHQNGFKVGCYHTGTLVELQCKQVKKGVVTFVFGSRTQQFGL